MLKRTLTAIGLSLAVLSHAALAADAGSDPTQKQDQQASDQNYWQEHNNEDRLYNFEP
jgi:hypothetical protein